MASELPFDCEDPFYRVGITLFDTPYLLDVRWNTRDSAWYFDILDAAEVPIMCGIKIVLGALSLWRCVDPRKPSGMMVAMDLSGKGREATIDDLGTRVIVVHYTVEELRALGGV